MVRRDSIQEILLLNSGTGIQQGRRSRKGRLPKISLKRTKEELNKNLKKKLDVTMSRNISLTDP